MTARDNKTWTWWYDALGQSVAVEKPNGTYDCWSYDAQNRLSMIWEWDSGFDCLDWLAYDKDPSGNITKTTNNVDGSYWQYAYDQRNRLTTANRAMAGNPTIIAPYGYTYDASGNMVTKAEPFKDDFANGSTAGWSAWSSTWSAANQYLERTSGTGGIGLANSGGDFDLWFSYENETAGSLLVCLRDAGGGNNTEYLHIQPTWMSLEQYVNNYWTGLDGAAVETDLDTWYDVHVQCVGGSITVWWGEQDDDMTQVLATTSAAVTSTQDFYFLPSSGTGYRFEHVSLTSSGLVKWTALAYNNGNELTSESLNGATSTTYTYDQYGRRSTKAYGGYQAVYKYAFGDKLLSVTSTFPDAIIPEEDYVYDGLGKLRYLGEGFGGGLSFRWEKGWNLAGIYFDSGPFDIWLGAWIRCIYNPQQDGLTPLATDNWYIVSIFPWETGYAYTYNFLDNIGSVRDVRDDSQNQQSFTEYDPYGGLYAGTSGGFFAGHFQDPGTGMYFAPYRWYDPEVARWMSRDPLGMINGPNLYEYVLDNPMLYIDPLGLTCREWLDAGIAVAGFVTVVVGGLVVATPAVATGTVVGGGALVVVGVGAIGFGLYDFFNNLNQGANAAQNLGNKVQKNSSCDPRDNDATNRWCDTH